MIRVCLVEDHRETRDVFLKLLRQDPKIVCVGACANAEQAMTEIPSLLPDVVLMDINLPGFSGIECVAKLKQAHPQIEFVMLTTYDDTDLIFNALRAGADGYLLKRSVPDDLLKAIHEVRAGGAPMSMKIARRFITHFREIKQPAGETATLSKRERELLDLLAKGLGDKRIADMLGISPSTVNNHLRRIYAKLHVQSRTEAVVKFLGR